MPMPLGNVAHRNRDLSLDHIAVAAENLAQFLRLDIAVASTHTVSVMGWSRPLSSTAASRPKRCGACDRGSCIDTSAIPENPSKKLLLRHLEVKVEVEVAEEELLQGFSEVAEVPLHEPRSQAGYLLNPAALRPEAPAPPLRSACPCHRPPPLNRLDICQAYDFRGPHLD